MGQESEPDETPLNEYLETFQDFQKLTTERVVKPFYHSKFIYKFTARKKMEDKLATVLRKLSTKFIQDRKYILNKQHNNSNDVKTKEKESLEKNSKIFLDLLLEQNEKGNMSDQQLRDEVDTIIFGGHDTTAATLMYFIILVGSYPTVQDRLVAEIQEIYGDLNEDVKKEDLTKLIYMEAVLKETMRMYPYMTFLARRIDNDLKFKNYTLSAGGRCLMFVYGLHRHSMWGADAEQFRPERWLEPSTLPSSPAAFAGFSWGKRACVGKTYAMMSMKTTVVHLLRRYRFSATHSALQLKFEFVLKAKAGHFVSIERRS